MLQSEQARLFVVRGCSEEPQAWFPAPQDGWPELPELTVEAFLKALTNFPIRTSQT